MTLLTQSFEGVPAGATIAPANTGTAPDTAFDSASIGANTTLVADTSRAAHGTQSCLVQIGATAAAVFASWTTAMGSKTQVWFRIYLYFPANPSSEARFFRAKTSGGVTLCGEFNISTTGKITLRPSSGSVINTSVSSVPLGAWFRIEGWIMGSSTAGQMSASLYTSMDSGTADETITSTATQNTAGAMLEYDWGDVASGAANVGPYSMDELGLSDTGPVGPVAPVLVPLSDFAATADVISLSTMSLAADTAAVSDGLAVTTSLPLADKTAVAEGISAAVSAPLADEAALADQLAASAAAGLSDRSAAVDSLQVAVSLAVADQAAVKEQAQPAIVVMLSDVAAIAGESLTGDGTANLADLAAITDVLTVAQGASPPGVFWTARPAGQLWKAVPADGRWDAGHTAGRWRAQPASRWAVRGLGSRWRILMATFDPVPAISLEYVSVTWTAELAGTVIDPTDPALPVEMAFPASSGDPAAPAEPVTWFAASWLTPSGQSKGYVAQCLIGPGGLVTLTAGQVYDVWSRVTSSPEMPARFAGTLEVY